MAIIGSQDSFAVLDIGAVAVAMTSDSPVGTGFV
jgi:hypothetical protein